MFTPQYLKSRLVPYIVNKCCIARRYNILTKNATIKVRRATLDDYDNVIEIRDPKELHGGYDPLPDTYKMLVESPKTKAYVATVNEKPVGLLIIVYCVNQSIWGNEYCTVHGRRLFFSYWIIQSVP